MQKSRKNNNNILTPHQKYLPNLYDWVVVPNAGHSVMMERPDEVSQAIRLFITDLEHLDHVRREPADS